MSNDPWSQHRQCDDCHRTYVPVRELELESDPHLGARNRYASYALARCYSCHLGLPPQPGPDATDDR